MIRKASALLALTLAVLTAVSQVGAAGGTLLQNTAPARTSLRSIGPSAPFTAFATATNAELAEGESYFSYQWALKNDGELRQTGHKLNIRSLDKIYVSQNENGDNVISLPPMGPSNYNTISTKAWKGIDINIQGAWDQYEQAAVKRPVTVAVIDTGIDISHKDLSSSIWVNEDEIPGDGIDNDNNGYIDDVNGWNFVGNNNQVYNGDEDSHGTHSAGTIAAAWDNAGITGIADGNYVKLMSLKALGGNGGQGSTESVMAAIRYAEANGAQICNLSFGSTTCSEELSALIRDSKMLFVVAAGNGDQLEIGYNIDLFPVYPASLPYDNIISVGNLLFNGRLDDTSNYGPTAVDIAAPGCYILSTIPDNSYAFMTGTSMAAPMVTGAAALIYSARPDLSLTDVRTAIISTAHKLAPLKGRMISSGMLDVTAAMNWGR